MSRDVMARKVAQFLPPHPDMTEAELVKLADSLIGVGMRLAGIIHDEDPADAWSLVEGLSDDRRWAVPFVMAAMIDIEKTATELLAWADIKVPFSLIGATSVAPSSLLLRERPRPTKLAECGTQAAWDRHIANGEEPCDSDWIAHRAWEAEKKQRQRRDRSGERARQRAAQAELDRHAAKFRAVIDAVEALRNDEQLELFTTSEPKEINADAA